MKELILELSGIRGDKPYFAQLLNGDFADLPELELVLQDGSGSVIGWEREER